MGRWEPGADARLREAALELYLEQGFERTTVAEIGERAGVTARTFFRHFADKREVLFEGSEELQDIMVAALDDVPASASPMAAVLAALEAIGELLVDREYSARRQSVIVANAELRERELIKMASLSRALSDGLRRRGVADVEAALAAEAGIAIFKVAFEHWVGESGEGTLTAAIQTAASHLRTLAGGR